MVVVPAETPLTTPVLEIVATAVLEEVQPVLGSGVPVPLSVDVLPTQVLNVPVITGVAFTVSVLLLCTRVPQASVVLAYIV